MLNVIWKLFDMMFLGGLQAFIFALLTVLYFGMAGAGHDEHEDDHDAAEAEKHDDEAEAHADAEPNQNQRTEPDRGQPHQR